MNTEEIFQNITYQTIFNKIAGKINNVVTDTRKIKENDLYIGLIGENFDGNDFYQEAFAKGAKVAILSKVNLTTELENYLKTHNKCIILVPDTIKALGELAQYKRSLFHKPVIAITGSAGKTSTKDMVYSVLNEKYNAYKTIGNQNNHIGLPLTILAMDPQKDVLVVEMGMNHLGEIDYLTQIAKPDVAVITNVGTAHIGNLGSRENILQAKLEILNGLSKEGTLVLNLDNDLLNKWYQNNLDNYHIKTFGIKEEAEYRAENIKEEATESTFNCQNITYHVPIGGEHFIYNALVAITIGSLFNLSTKEIQKGIDNFELSRNRMHVTQTKGITIIDDCYNSNFDSLSYSIKYLGTLRGRKIAVLGTMLELGKYSEKLHSDIGSLIVEEDIDILITVGEYTNLINEKALALGFNKDNSYHFTNNNDAINLINKLKQKDDNILIKASMRLNFKEIVDQINN